MFLLNYVQITIPCYDKEFTIQNVSIKCIFDKNALTATTEFTIQNVSIKSNYHKYLQHQHTIIYNTKCFY